MCGRNCKANTPQGGPYPEKDFKEQLGKEKQDANPHPRMKGAIISNPDWKKTAISFVETKVNLPFKEERMDRNDDIIISMSE